MLNSDWLGRTDRQTYCILAGDFSPYNPFFQKRELSSTDLKRQIDFQSEFYLNLRRKENLEYFLHLFQRILSTIDQNHLRITTMSCVLLLDAILILTAVVRVFVLGRSPDLLTIWCLIDIIILSLYLMLFVMVVVLINKSINYDFIRYLRTLKRDLFTSRIKERDRFDCDNLSDMNLSRSYMIQMSVRVRIIQSDFVRFGGFSAILSKSYKIRYDFHKILYEILWSYSTILQDLVGILSDQKLCLFDLG